MKRQWTAMRTQANATYGLNLSPIRANFQNVPRNPVLFLSKRDGQIDLKYAHVQTASRSTVSNDWKWNKADIFYEVICMRRLHVILVRIPKLFYLELSQENMPNLSWKSCRMNMFKIKLMFVLMTWSADVIGLFALALHGETETCLKLDTSALHRDFIR